MASGAPEAAWVAGEPPETRLHTRVAVVFVECSSSTLPKSWQLCRKCKHSPLRCSFMYRLEDFLVYYSGFQPFLSWSGEKWACSHLFQECCLIYFVEAAGYVCI